MHFLTGEKQMFRQINMLMESFSNIMTYSESMLKTSWIYSFNSIR